jgi:glutaminyl-tRNA synthetase
VRLKNAYIIKAESVVKIVRALLLKYMLLMTMLVVVGGSEASQRKVAVHWVSIKHAVEAEVRLYDRLFIDEARTAIKKNFGIQNSNSLEIVKGFVEPSLASSLAGINFSSNVWVISIQIKIACQEN